MRSRSPSRRPGGSCSRWCCATTSTSARPSPAARATSRHWRASRRSRPAAVPGGHVRVAGGGRIGARRQLPAGGWRHHRRGRAGRPGDRSTAARPVRCTPRGLVRGARQPRPGARGRGLGGLQHRPLGRTRLLRRPVLPWRRAHVVRTRGAGAADHRHRHLRPEGRGERRRPALAGRAPAGERVPVATCRRASSVPAPWRWPSGLVGCSHWAADAQMRRRSAPARRGDAGRPVGASALGVSASTTTLEAR